MNLFIDDIRNPKTGHYTIARNYAEAVKFMRENGCPDFISFDHDLGENQPSGYDIAKWMVNKDLDMNGEFIPKKFMYEVHSANPVGRENIRGLLTGYLKAKRAAK